MSEPMQRANRWILAAMFGLAWVGIASAQTYWLQPAIPGTSRYLPPAGTPQNPLYFYRDGYPLGQFSRPGLNQPFSSSRRFLRGIGERHTTTSTRRSEWPSRSARGASRTASTREPLAAG